MLLAGPPFERRLYLLPIAFQALLFYNFYAREIAFYPPLNFDWTVSRIIKLVLS
jgi:hypothetical protein